MTITWRGPTWLASRCSATGLASTREMVQKAFRSSRRPNREALERRDGMVMLGQTQKKEVAMFEGLEGQGFVVLVKDEGTLCVELNGFEWFDFMSGKRSHHLPFYKHHCCPETVDSSTQVEAEYFLKR